MIIGMIGFSFTIAGMVVGAREYYNIFISEKAEREIKFNKKIFIVLRRVVPFFLIGITLLIIAENYTSELR